MTGVSSDLLGVLISEVAIPELLRWLHTKNGDPITDADILKKLQVDADAGIAKGKAWLAAHALG